jgi:hypothetical protein
LAALTPAQGVIIHVTHSDNHISVSSAGDVDGDGFDDLIIGAYGPLDAKHPPVTAISSTAVTSPAASSSPGERPPTA